eukprot:TRINITY_DN13446_c1_g2_i3.p1 TRINITY_DN13446_c1_g2~~TRINITY_DN13446_c1_g2_i3.p1  ORF type:complete len:508 (-),score=88.08 TRINITY_DN13446_c1_g2_i3:28-1551(-)
MAPTMPDSKGVSNDLAGHLDGAGSSGLGERIDPLTRADREDLPLVVITFADNKYRSALVNWMARLVQLRVDNFLVVCADKALSEFMSAIDRPCYHLSSKSLSALCFNRLEAHESNICTFFEDGMWHRMHVDYFGQDVGQVKTDTAHECQLHCAATEFCNCFTWKTYNLCFMKESCNVSRLESSSVSGPKSCEVVGPAFAVPLLVLAFYRLFLLGADEEAADVKTWCEGCSGLISARLRPTLLHRSNTRLCYVDCVRCTVTDVLPSVLMSFCENCNAENVHKQEFVRNRIIDGTCFGCHSKYAFGAQSISIDQITPCEMGGHSGVAKSSRSSKDAIDDPMDEIAEELRYLRKKAKTDPRQQLIKLGSALPQMGACRHFKKSYKWFRFACCGRAFPCPECHVESECPAAALGAHANRMICGKCSMEQSYSPARPCEKCGFTMQAKGSSHWDGGIGTRNLATMSSKDAKKFKGGLRQSESKFKTSSKKTDRVGAKAKAKRDQEQKFGKDK